MGNPYRVLFLCTGNSARSIMAEAVLNRAGAGRFEAYSAGSQPAGRVNPLTLEVLQARGYPTGPLRSKAWDEFATPDAPRMDAIITVCDNAAGEACPVWPGRPATAHWPFEDPAACEGPDAVRRARFESVYEEIARRVEALARRSPEALQEDARAVMQELGAR